MGDRGRRTIKTFLLSGLALVGVFAVGHVVSAAAVNLGLTPEVGGALGLGTQDIRVTIATILRNFMALLGIVAVALVLYGGFLYMTSQGEEAQIDKAKKILVSAAIGLGIVLSAAAITQFVINALVGATGTSQGGGGGGYGTGAGGNLPPGSFFVKDISPSQEVPIRNIVVRIMLSLPIDASTAASNVSVIGPNGSVSGTVSTYGDLIEFEPNSPCPDPNGGLRCFGENTDYTVTVSGGLKGYGGQNLVCGGLAPSCVAHFRSGDKIDLTAPDPVEITSPDDGQSIPENTSIPIQVHAVDDAAISYVEAFADGVSVGKDSPGSVLADFLASILWDKDIVLGDHTLSAQAHDVDKHLSGSDTVSVAVRPLHCFNKKQDVDELDIDCGGSCGSCGGGACTQNSDCVSGLCLNGICVDRPRIDAVTPVDQANRPNGAPGTLVTISGAFFGSSIGTVAFYGSSSTTAKTADLCDTAAWTDSEITVKVPADAIDGPIVVTAASGQTDATNDDRGPIVEDFDVNSATHPGICHLSPSVGEPGTAVTLTGVGFGAAQGNGGVDFRLDNVNHSVGNLPSAAWQDTQVDLNVPNLGVSSRQSAMVRLTQDGTVSNSKTFGVEPIGSGKAPRIDAIDPATGPVGQYVSVLGANFGSSVGTVLFTLPDQTTAVAATDFPPLCGTDYWKDGSVMVKVPAYYKDGVTPVQDILHSIRVRRADGVESNLSAFTIVAGAAGPGICALIPDNGPASTTKVDVIGERFGTIVGKVRFADASYADVPANWGDTMLSKVRVPGDAKTGLVHVVDAGTKESNGANFLVGSCSSSNQCSVGLNCCGDGSCRADCSGISLTGAFAWRFSTGEIPHLPQMIEQLTCSDSTQTPSPYKGSQDACSNAVVSGRIDADMDDPTVVANVVLYRCGTGSSFDPATCDRSATVPKGAETFVTPVSSDEDLFTYTPASLDAGRWYEAAVLSNPTTSTPYGAKSVDGLYLDGDFDGVEGGDYVWRFKIRADGTACAVDHVEVNPSEYLLEAKNAVVGYRADPTAANCNQLQCSAYTWQWSSVLADPIQTPGDAYAPLSTVVGQPACVRRATALQETPPGVPVRESATLTQYQASDYGNLSISYLKPEVVGYWPACAGACVNAQVGVKFNVGMDGQTLNKANFSVCQCTEESCTNLVSCSDANPAVSVTFGPPVKDAQGNDHIVSAYISGLPTLKKQTWYRALVRGTAVGVRSESGGELQGLNYGPNYSWKFRTRDDAALCEVDSVRIEPKEGSVYVFGDVLPYQSVPVSKGDDKCGPTPLDPFTYDWQWSTENVQALALPEGGQPGQLTMKVATLDFGGTKDFLPLKGAIGCSAMCLRTGSIAGDSVCGNGIVEKGEDCDDGNAVSGDGCSEICLAEGATGGATCGNGAVERGTPGSASGPRGENCDDGNSISGDGCNAKCLAEGSAFGAAECGNGHKDTGENCDDGNLGSGDGCSPTCTLEGSIPGKSVCGDGQIGVGESCDDGNTVSGDGCSASCLREGAGSAGGCGNGTVDKGEECDDGNTTAGDGCGATCLFEKGGSAQCLPNQTVDCCGDGIVSSVERCDPGILAQSKANCNPAKCVWLGLAACANPGPNSSDVGCCGNGKVELGETCDDGNLSSGDGCGAKCFYEGTIPVSICGDGKIGLDEDCDDGNAVSGDGCSAKCLSEGTSVIGSVCGNGDVGKGETCDDGNNSSGDGCSAWCLKEGTKSSHPVCGNSKIEDGEDCDDGNTVSGDGCGSSCLAEGTDRCTSGVTQTCCGNGNVEKGETCDDGNLLAGDGCGERCLSEGSSARYNLMSKSSSYCGYAGDVAPPSVYGTGEMCEWPTSGDGNSDPLQYARAAFGGESKIVSSVQNPVSLTQVDGSGKFDFLCACANDSSCTQLVPSGSVPANGIGCGIGKCCYGRPYPKATSPLKDATGVCRNAYVAATWDRVMDKGTFTSSTLLLVKKANQALLCDDGTDLPMLSGFPTVNSGYCLATSTPAALYSVGGIEVPADPGQQGNGENSGNVVTELTIDLRQALEPNVTYGVLVYGDHDLGDDVTEGVASAAKVAMAGDYFWSFTTGAEICKLDHVAIAPATWLFSTAQNDVADDAPGPLFDSISDSDKQFVASAYAKSNGGFERISPVSGYDWDWGWASSDEKNDSLDPLALGDKREQWVKTVPSPKNGRVTLTAAATIVADLTGPSCASDAECGTGGKCVEPLPGKPKTCAGKQYAATSEVTVMLCENPWPARDQYGGWKPFADDQGAGATNFSTYFCRDKGAKGTADDFPAPATGQPVSVPHQNERVCSNDVTVACTQNSDCQKPGGICLPKFLRDFLFPLQCSGGRCNPGDAFGFRVMPNYEHQEIKKWYALQGFGAAPTAGTTDGYQSLSDGRTTYVSAANKVGDPDIYTNVYLLSYNEGASADTRRVASLLAENWNFNVNAVSSGICRAKVCSEDASVGCVTDVDCDGKGTCSLRTCSADSDCGAAGGVCNAVKDKLRRDVSRYVDFREIESGLESYRTQSLRCSKTVDRACLADANCPTGEHCVGDYPSLTSGSFVRGASVSIWDSWQNALGQAIGSKQMPVDPLNELFCDSDHGYDSTSCYNGQSSTYSCLAGSHAYQYRKSGKAYTLSTEFEFKTCSDDGMKTCRSDQDCAPTGSCVVPNWQGAGPASHVEYDDNGNAYVIQNAWEIQNMCGAAIGGTSSVCGDGVVGPGEECEPGATKLVQCLQGAYPGYATLTCVASGPSACNWGPVVGCSAGFCGDGIVQPSETCDDGSANGTYGHCETDCKKPAKAGHCGDGTVQGNEQCDVGGHCRIASSVSCTKDSDCTGAGDWCVGIDKYSKTGSGGSCSFDCKSVGPFCGDKTIQAEYGESCDGNTEIDTAYCPVCPDPATLTYIQKLDEKYANCTSATIGRKQIRTRGCSDGTQDINQCTSSLTACKIGQTCTCTACKPLNWGACTPVGVCGDGVTDPGEECDDGNDDNSDGCVIVKKYDSVNKAFVVDTALSCKKATCGDNYVQGGVEACDTGAKNVNPTDKTRVQAIADACPYGKVCSFCTTACQPGAVSGGYCGDLKVTPAYEMCEPGLGKGNYGGDPTVQAKYAGVDQICYPNCKDWCPPAMRTTPELQFVKTLQSPNYVPQVDAMKNGEQWYLAVPPCRYLDGINAEMDFTSARKPTLDVMMVIDTSADMDEIYTGSGAGNGQQKIVLARKFASDLVTRLGQEYALDQGKLRIGVLTTPTLLDKWIWYRETLSQCTAAGSGCCAADHWATGDGSGKATLDDNGFCWMNKTKTNTDTGSDMKNYDYCDYDCAFESLTRSPVGFSDPNGDGDLFMKNVGDNVTKISSFLGSGSLKSVTQDTANQYSDLNATVKQARIFLNASESEKKLLVVITGRDTGSVCGGGACMIGETMPPGQGYCGPVSYILHLENGWSQQGSCFVAGEGYVDTNTHTTSYYGYKYDQANDLVNKMFKAVSIVNLTFNGKTKELTPGGIQKLDLNGLVCTSKEQRIGFKLDWGGQGFVQVKNVTPSYCPLVESLPSEGTQAGISGLLNLGGTLGKIVGDTYYILGSTIKLIKF